MLCSLTKMNGRTVREFCEMTDFILTIPVVFIIFNRPDTAEKVFNEIKKVRPTKLYLVSDAARDGREEEREKVGKCRHLIESMIDWDCEVIRDYAIKNMGCKNRVSSGISGALKNEESVIILEDDVVPSPDFFPFMQQMLTEYRYEEKVMMVSGTNLLRDYKIKGDYTFSFFSSIWGWGTWNRAWMRYYDPEMKDWADIENKKRLRKVYRNPLAFALFKKDADIVYNGGKDTWDLQWDYCRMKRGALGIVPASNMINNIGFDREDATHTTGMSFEDFSYGSLNLPCRKTEPIEEDLSYDMAYLKKYMGLRRIVNAVRKRLFSGH